MSGLGAQFVMMATSGMADERQPPEPKSEVSWKMCQGDCLEHTAHLRRRGYWECSLCQNRIYDKSTETTGQDDDQV